MNEELLANILRLLEERRLAEISAIFRTMTPQDIAELLGQTGERELSILFRMLPKDTAAEVFVAMEGTEQELLLKAFNDRELHEILNELFVDDTVDIIEEMPANVVRRIISHCDKEMRDQINEVLKYPKDSAGSIMTPEYISLRREMTVEEAFARIRKTGMDSETIYTCYVIEKNRTLVGMVTAKQLLLSPMDKLVGDIMTENVLFVETTLDKEDVAKMFDKYDFLAFPVVDTEKRLVGIVTVDDAMDVIREETNEDFSKMAAMTPSTDTYFRTGVWKQARNRIPWLLILMVSATVTGQITTGYEAAFQAIPLLIACLPMIMDTGGNCGSQTSTLVIRGMAVDEMTPRDFWKVWWKEIRIALVVGLTLALVNVGRVFLFYGSSGQVLPLAITSSLALVCTVCIAKSLGCAMPMLAKACKLDPAIMASPLITTIVDAVGVTIYFSLAVKVFSMFGVLA